jgi:hypothetical protein
MDRQHEEVLRRHEILNGGAVVTRIAIAGAAGRMGRNLIIACDEADDMALTQALEQASSPALGTDSGILAGLEPNSIPIVDRLDPDAFDTLIDFTHPSATTRHVDFCLQHDKKMVIGTTGCDSSLEQKLTEAGQKIAIVYAPNMSVCRFCAGRQRGYRGDRGASSAQGRCAFGYSPQNGAGSCRYPGPQSR